MRKLSTDYFGWAILMFAVLGMLTLFIWAFRFGFNIEPRVMFDLSGISIMVAASFLIAVELWEVSLLVSLLLVELQGIKFVDGDCLILKKGDQETRYKLKDVTLIESFDQYANQRALTQHLTYSKIMFKSNDIIYITSFTLNLTEADELFPYNGIKKIRRERKFFELVK